MPYRPPVACLPGTAAAWPCLVRPIWWRSPVGAAPQLTAPRARAHSQRRRSAARVAVGSGHGRGAAAPRRGGGPRSIMIGGWQGASAIQQLWRRGRPAGQGAPHRRVLSFHSGHGKARSSRCAKPPVGQVPCAGTFVDRRDRGSTYVYIRRALVLFSLQRP
jgi:hypothetical protein